MAALVPVIAPALDIPPTAALPLLGRTVMPLTVGAG
jgi:hypothetical protein